MELSTSEIIAIAQLVSSEIDRTSNQKVKDALTVLLGKIEDEVIKRKSAENHLASNQDYNRDEKL
jgi:hypothetical protein